MSLFGIEFQCLAVVGQRAVVISFGVEINPAHVVGQGMSRIQFDSLVVVSD